MIDIHTHILPGLDDGCKNLDETLEVLTQYKKQGVSKVVATPHFGMGRESIRCFIERRNRVAEQIPTGDGFPKIILGAEVYYTGIDFSRYEDIEKLCIGNGPYMLIETNPTRLGNDIVDCFKRLMFERGIIPILAHVERYYFIGNNKSIIRKLSSEGTILQMNTELFLNFLSRNKAMRILQSEKVELIGSDCHNISNRPPNIKKAFELISHKLGNEIVSRMNEKATEIIKD